MSKYLVTGGAGFIGSNIVRALLCRGQRVRVLDNFATGRRANLAGLEREIELAEGDIRDLEAVRRGMVGVDCVIHQAALPSVARSLQDPLATHQSNATGTLQVLVAARDAGVQRVVYASSSSVYGDSPKLPKVEDMPPQPLSPYAVSKLAGEQYCAVFAQLYGLETVCLRYFNAFGPRQDPTSEYAAVVPRFITAMLRGERPTIYGDGTQSRDFTFVANTVDATLLAAEAPGVAGQCFNIACGRRYTLLELVAVLNAILGTRLEPHFTDPRSGDVKHSLADISKAQRGLGYSPQVSFEEGLRRTVEWFRTGASP